MRRESLVEVRAKYLILLLLAKGPMYGYEIIKAARSILGELSIGSPSAGTVYPILHRLVEEGLIEPIGDLGPRGARVYRLTPRGAMELLTMMDKALNIFARIVSLHGEPLRNIIGLLKSSEEAYKLLERIKGKLLEVSEAIKKLTSIVDEAIAEQRVRPRAPSS